MTQANFTQMHPADLQAVLKKNGLTQRDIAKLLDIDQRWVSIIICHGSRVFAAIDELTETPAA